MILLGNWKDFGNAVQYILMKDEDKIIYSRRNNVVDSVVNNFFVEILPFHHFLFQRTFGRLIFLMAYDTKVLGGFN